MANPFASKKFVYAVTSIIMYLVVAYLPALTAEFGLSLSPETLDQINANMPLVLVLGFALLGGHTLMDALSMYTGYQPKTLNESGHDVIDELLPAPASMRQEIAEVIQREAVK